ncbi:MAG: M56 family metallopeptidase [Ignavibacteria bacterium]|jgi:HEAT repeat protein/beta-lactamase regulating signal transducer with metallopeptidase domain
MNNILIDALKLIQTNDLLNLLFKSAIVLTIAEVTVTLMKRNSASLRHWIWSISLFSLLILPVIICLLPAKTLPVLTDASIYQNKKIYLGEAVKVNPVDKSPSSALAKKDKIIVGNEFKENYDRSPKVTLTKNVSNATYGIQRTTNIAWELILYVLWLLGVMVGIALLTFNFLKIKLLLKNGKCINNIKWDECLYKKCKQLKINKRIKLIIHPAVSVPAVFGFRKPVLFVPEKSVDWSYNKINIVILHELAHLKRFDFISNILVQLTCIIYWMNPLVWFAARKFYLEQEQCCDDIVISKGIEHCDYAELLLEVAGAISRKISLRNFALSMARKSGLKLRIKHILSTTIPRSLCRSRFITISSILLLVIIVPLSIIKLQGRTPSDRELKYNKAIQELNSSVNSVQEKAAWALGDLEDKRAVDQLIKTLDDDDPMVRAMAAWALGEIKEQSSLDALIEHLLDKNDYTKEMIIRAIGELENKSSVNDLVMCLSNNNPDIRYATVWALGEIRNEESFAAVVKALKDTSLYVKETAINILGQTGSKENTQYLVPLLKDKSPRIRCAAASTIGRLGNKESVKHLVNSLDDKNDRVILEVVRVLGKIKDPSAVEPLLILIHSAPPEIRAMTVWTLDEIRGH